VGDDAAEAVDAIEVRRELLRAKLVADRAELLARVSEIDRQIRRLSPPPGDRAALPTGRLDAGHVLRATARYFRMPVDKLLGPDRHASVARARHVAMYLARKLTGDSFPELGSAFGSRDHTTVIAAVGKVRALLLEDGGARAVVDDLERIILEGAGRE
jgi:chromosomal replication initiator protein